MVLEGFSLDRQNMMANGSTGAEEIWEGITPSTPEGMATKATLILIAKRQAELPCSIHADEIKKNSDLRKRLIVGFTVLSIVVVTLRWIIDFFK